MAVESPSFDVLLFPVILSFSLMAKALFWCRLLSSYSFPLSHIPGPSWAAWTRLWLIRTLASGDSARRFVDVNKQHGPLARIGPNNLITSDPAAIRRILSAGSQYTRAPWYNSVKIDPHINNVASERDPKKHSKLRQKLAPGYAGHGIDDIEPSIDRLLLKWLHRINSVSVSGAGHPKSFDIGKSIQYLTVDIVTELCLGRAFGCVDSDSDKYGFLSSVRTGSAITQHFSVLTEIPELMYFLTKFRFLRRFLVPSAKDQHGIGKVMNVIRQAVDERLQPEAPLKKDMLNGFLERGIPQEHIETELVVTLVAGSDTTSTSVQGTLLAVISDARVYKKLQQEIDAAVVEGRVSSPIQENEAKRLPYLQACIMEGLRRHPPISQLRERVVPPGGDMLNGYWVPGGTYVGLNSWGTQLDRVYGDDPEVYRPERWLIEDKDRLAAMRRTHELIFSHGPTKCLGIRIATMELHKIFFELFRHFDIAATNSLKPWRSTCYGIFFQDDFNVRVTRRELRRKVKTVT